MPPTWHMGSASVPARCHANQSDGERRMASPPTDIVNTHESHHSPPRSHMTGRGAGRWWQIFIPASEHQEYNGVCFAGGSRGQAQQESSEEMHRKQCTVQMSAHANLLRSSKGGSLFLFCTPAATTLEGVWDTRTGLPVEWNAANTSIIVNYEWSCFYFNSE